MREVWKRAVGPRDFYKKMLAVAVPIMIQDGITNFVGMLDNIMVGRIGTVQMSGVSIVNQLMFVYNLCCFGGFAGAGIFTAQFYGRGDDDGVRHTFRFKLLTAALIVAVGFTVFLLGGDALIGRYLTQEGGGEAVAATMGYARQYLAVMLAGLIPFALSQAYASTLRECSETVLPMAAGITAVLVNLGLNYVLIFGKFGAPALGVVGAAAATVISRIVELLIVAVYAHTKAASKYPFFAGVFRSFKIPAGLVKSMLKKGMPLLVNEFLWSSGMATLLQCYSVRGLMVIGAFNISTTISNVFNIVFISMGSATAIILGQELGARKPDVKADAHRLAVFSVLMCTLTGACLYLIAPVFPRIYNTEEEVRALAASFITVAALCSPMYAYENASYFTLRSGGKTLLTFLFDSCFVWALQVPAAYLLSRYTQVPIVPLYAIVQLLGLVKCALGVTLVQKGIWIHDITGREDAPGDASAPPT